MSNLIAWMAAEAERSEPGLSTGIGRRARSRDELPGTRELPRHNFPETQTPVEANAKMEETPSCEERREAEEDRERERRTYRARTVAMLKRYIRYSIETGRLPSLLGREFFRAKVTSYTVVTFQDRIIVVHDMEKCLDRLDEFSRQLIARHILQEHDQMATGRLLHCNERTVRTYIPIVLDLFTEILLSVGLLQPIETKERRNSCQEGENDQILLSDCKDGRYKV